MNAPFFDPNSPQVLLANIIAEQKIQNVLLAKLEATQKQGQIEMDAALQTAVERIEKSAGARLSALEEKVGKLESWKMWSAGAAATAVLAWEGLKDMVINRLGSGNHP